MSNTKDFILNMVMWVGLSIGISLLISFFVPFPFSLIGIVIVLVLMGYFFRKKRMMWDNRSRM
ncbi:hypothetical protein [Candidatus Nitrosocosmicus franklandus]|uniref:hypothetical protein n=1 Tax=Candidatus Nitrosocosmicus franklandianus TaxID=1798806 RepID=UPI00106BF006|nr:hypothetical protein [Candidatus Nitrosocosmicus franklandus]